VAFYNIIDNIGPSLPLTVTTTGHKFTARTINIER